MKKIFLLFLFFSFFTGLFAQDIIITKKGERIEAKVITVYEAVIKYALFSDPDGPTFLIMKSKIESLTYANGVVEILENEKSNTAESNVIALNTAKPEKIFKNVIKVKPLATVIGAVLGFFELDLQYARYLTPKIAIPVEVDFVGGGNLGMAFGFMTGIEGVPVTHRQKSGLYLNALAGVIIYDGVSVLANPNIGYQLITKSGFAFSATIGALYSGYTNVVTPRFSLDFGFAF